MITNINLDIFKYDSDAIVHQANCFTTMGSGVAKRLRELYPEAYEADCKTSKGDKSKLGSFSVVKARDGKYIYNMYSQFTYGTEKRQTNYEAIYTGLCAVKSHMIDAKLVTLSLPKGMGCKLGGGDWRIVSKMIEVIFEDGVVDVIICNYDPSVPATTKIFDEFE